LRFQESSLDQVQVYVKEMVLDDDASTRALLTHCLKELADFVLGFEWPKDSAGKRITKDVGKPPVDHPVIVFLVDLMHRIRCFGKYVFGLALASQSTSTCTMVDAYRLKRNFGHWMLSCHTMTFHRAAPLSAVAKGTVCPSQQSQMGGFIEA
jgi:hypothetical protein